MKRIGATSPCAERLKALRFCSEQNLSPRIFNAKTSLVIGLPMSTAEYNADNPFAVAVGQVMGRKTGQIDYVLCHRPKSFAWRLRGASPHPMKHLSDGLFAQVSERLNQIIRLA